MGPTSKYGPTSFKQGYQRRKRELNYYECSIFSCLQLEDRNKTRVSLMLHCCWNRWNNDVLMARWSWGTGGRSLCALLTPARAIVRGWLKARAWLGAAGSEVCARGGSGGTFSPRGTGRCTCLTTGTPGQVQNQPRPRAASFSPQPLSNITIG